MGYLHEGHLSLVAQARRLVGPRGRVVVMGKGSKERDLPLSDFARDAVADYVAHGRAVMAPEGSAAMFFNSPFDSPAKIGREPSTSGSLVFATEFSWSGEEPCCQI